MIFFEFIMSNVVWESGKTNTVPDTYRREKTRQIERILRICLPRQRASVPVYFTVGVKYVRYEV